MLYVNDALLHYHSMFHVEHSRPIFEHRREEVVPKTYVPNRLERGGRFPNWEARKGG